MLTLKNQTWRRAGSTISGWWFGTMEFYDFIDFPHIGNVIIPTYPN
jgi:hypothetical protein